MWTTLVILCCVRYGTDRHTWDVPFDEFENSALYGAFLAEIAFLISTCCTKVSILLFYRRLTEGTYNRKWKWATVAAIVFTIVFCLAFMLVLIFQCRPTEAYWKSLTFTYTQDFKCSNTKILNPISGSLSVVSDFYSVLLPMAMTRHFDIDRRKKIALNAVFSLGLLVVAAGAIRTYFLTKLGYDYDITWLGYDVFVWATLELQLAIMCACAPALRVLFRRYLRDPLSRAVQTASSKSRSANRSNNRDSKHLDVANPNEAMDYSGTGDKKLIDRSTKTTMGTIDEREVESFTSTSPSEQKVIKTPADFEAYALQNLERYRADPYNNRTPTRYRDDYIMQSNPDGQNLQRSNSKSSQQYVQFHRPITPHRRGSERSNTQHGEYERTDPRQIQWGERSDAQYQQYQRPNAPYTQRTGPGAWLDADSR